MNNRGRSGGDERRRRVWVSGAAYGDLVAALAESIGVEVVREDGFDVDLRIIETDQPSDLPAFAAEGPLMALAPRRLSETETTAMRGAGARFVLDSEATLLDVGFALSELLFSTICEQRKYWRSVGGTPVRFWIFGDEENASWSAVVVGLAREGGFLRTAQRLADGTAIEIALDLPSGEARVRARVAYSAEDGVAIEFALDDQNVAPRVGDLIPGRKVASSRGPRLRRRESGAAIS